MRIAEFVICVILVIVGMVVLWDVYQSWKHGDANDSTVWVGAIGTLVGVPALYTAAKIADGDFFTMRDELAFRR